MDMIDSFIDCLEWTQAVAHNNIIQQNRDVI